MPPLLQVPAVREDSRALDHLGRRVAGRALGGTGTEDSDHGGVGQGPAPATGRLAHRGLGRGHAVGDTEEFGAGPGGPVRATSGLSGAERQQQECHQARLVGADAGGRLGVRQADGDVRVGALGERTGRRSADPEGAEPPGAGPGYALEHALGAAGGGDGDDEGAGLGAAYVVTEEALGGLDLAGQTGELLEGGLSGRARVQGVAVADQADRAERHVGTGVVAAGHPSPCLVHALGEEPDEGAQVVREASALADEHGAVHGVHGVRHGCGGRGGHRDSRARAMST